MVFVDLSEITLEWNLRLGATHNVPATLKAVYSILSALPSTRHGAVSKAQKQLSEEPFGSWRLNAGLITPPPHPGA